MGQVIQIDEARIRDHLGERVRGTLEEALNALSLAGVSVRRVEDITGALRGARVSPSTVSSLNGKISARIAAWRGRPIEGAHPCVSSTASP